MLLGHGGRIMPQDHRGRLERSQIETNQQMAWWTKVVGIFTAVLAVLNIPTLLFVGWQAWTAARVAEETRSQLRAVMQIASLQTVAGVMEITLTPSFGFLATFQNLGSTRAEKVKGWQSVQYFEGDIPFNSDLSKPAKEIEIGNPTVVGPNATFQMSPVAVKPGEIDKAVRREGILVMWGNITYSDIYSPTVTHSISFCQRITVAQPSADSKDKQLIFSMTPFRSDCNKSE